MVAVQRKTFVDDLSCHVRRLTYDFIERRGVLELPPMNCANMGGCIRIFEQIDPQVEIIETIAGEGGTGWDGTYVKDGGTWRSVKPAKAALIP